MRAFGIGAVLLGLAACQSMPAVEVDEYEDALRIPVTIDAEGGQVVFQSEVADSPEERSKGLMFRKTMGEARGMIFLFAHESQQSFWMRNTLIPLDMIFIKSDQSILGVVENATPQTDTPRQVPGLSQFVLELNAGQAKKHGIAAGQHVTWMAPLPTR